MSTYHWPDLPAPDFDEVEKGLTPGLYSARRLNPPGGEDCVALLVRDDGSLGWAYADGSQSEDSRGYTSRFSVRELCAP